VRGKEISQVRPINTAEGINNKWNPTCGKSTHSHWNKFIRRYQQSCTAVLPCDLLRLLSQH